MNSITQPVTHMTSREIAEITGKQHSHVMRDIRDMVENLETAKEADPKLDWHCESVTYTDEQGKLRDQYRLDKNTTLTLLTGYRADLRMKVIQRWQELEASSHVLPQSFADALQLATQSTQRKAYRVVGFSLAA